MDVVVETMERRNVMPNRIFSYFVSVNKQTKGAGATFVVCVNVCLSLCFSFAFKFSLSFNTIIKFCEKRFLFGGSSAHAAIDGSGNAF